MIRVRCLVLALCFMAFSVCNSSAATPDEEAISRFMNQDMAAAWKSNAPGNVLELFSEAVPVVWLDVDKNTPPVTNKEARKKDLESFFNKVQVLDFVVADVVVTKISDSLAIVTCTEKMSLMEKASKEQEQIVGRTVYEVIKEKDKWRAYREISSVDVAVE